MVRWLQYLTYVDFFAFFFSSRGRHTRFDCDWSSDVCSSDLLTGAVPVLYDGHPAYPTPDVLWKMADEAGVVTFGSSPTYVEQLSRSGIVPRERYPLTALRTINLAGSPASPEGMGWFYADVEQGL